LTATDKGIGTIYKSEFRYSYNDEVYSEFVDLSDTALQSIEILPEEELSFQFKFTLLSGGPLEIFSLTLFYTLADNVSEEGTDVPDKGNESVVYDLPVIYREGASWDPYKLNRAVGLWKDLNLMVNTLFGHEVNYYRANPHTRSADVHLMEYSLYKSHDELKCIKVVVPNNQFPDNKFNMGPFGVDFEMPFEIHIDKNYFQKIFGVNTAPQKRDVLHFLRTDRIYEISSAYLFRDFMNEPLYFKVSLVKWAPKSNVEQSPVVNSLEDLTVSNKKLFGEAQRNEQIDLTSPEQITEVTLVNDPVRSYLDPDIIITSQRVLNYYLVVSESYYDMSSTVADNRTIRTSVDQNISLTAGNTYFLRNGVTSSQVTNELYESLKKLEYMGKDDEGYDLFDILPGNSDLSSEFFLHDILGPSSSTFVYSEEYASGSTPSYLFAATGSYEIVDYVNVKYNGTASFPSSTDKSFSAWFKMQEGSTSDARNFASFTVDPMSFEISVNSSREYDLFTGEWVRIYRRSGGNFEIFARVKRASNETSFILTPDRALIDYIDTVFPSWKTYTDLSFKKTRPRNLISSFQNGKGIKVDIIGKRHVKVNVGGNITYFSISNASESLAYDEWYAYCLVISNKFSQMTLNLWKRKWDEDTNLPATSDLENVFSKTVSIQKEDRSAEGSWYILPSEMYLTNIRIFNEKLESDKQPIVLNQNIVKDARLSEVIDNAVPRSEMPYIEDLKTMPPF
jgi:hypothetical protein